MRRRVGKQGRLGNIHAERLDGPRAALFPQRGSTLREPGFPVRLLYAAVGSSIRRDDDTSGLTMGPFFRRGEPGPGLRFRKRGQGHCPRQGDHRRALDPADNPAACRKNPDLAGAGGDASHALSAAKNGSPRCVEVSGGLVARTAWSHRLPGILAAGVAAVKI